MNDLLVEEAAQFNRLEAAFARHARLHGFAEVRTPYLEPTELFVRSMGEVTDVVQKEMYTLERGDESLTLRPEGTAGAVRAYVQHAVHAKEPVTRWFYTGPMFRAERPQRGRLRQFHQSGCEILGDPSPMADAELMAMLVGLFSELRIEGLVVKVNSIGDADSRKRYRDALVEFLTPRKMQLSELSQQRLDSNPLRVLDSKHEGDQTLLNEAPSTLDSLSDEDRAHFDEVCALLTAFGLSYQVDTKLVRGLDYYTRTVFELQTNAGNLGAQNTIAAGGRYDLLVRQLGGPDIPAVGFAIGLERILLAMAEQQVAVEPFCALLPLGKEATRRAASLAKELRAKGVRVELDGRDNSLKSKLRRANSMGASVALVLGESEAEHGTVQLKNLVARTQEECPNAQLADRVVVELSTIGAQQRASTAPPLEAVEPKA